MSSWTIPRRGASFVIALLVLCTGLGLGIGLAPARALGEAASGADTGSAPPALQLYIDADFAKSGASSNSIELGVRTALRAAGDRLGGLPVEVIAKDNRNNLKLSARHLEQMQTSDNVLALIGGMSSPPYLKNRDFINENRLLTLLPWSAAGPITRARLGAENWIFRLSVDDFYSGEFLVKKAVEEGQCRRIALLLMDTSWGHTNRNSLTAALNARGLAPALTQYFPTTLGQAAAGTLTENLGLKLPDCVILLASWQSGAVLLNALGGRLPQTKVYSHWGIMGGDFAAQVPQKIRDDLDLEVLQTCGLRREREDNAALQQALAQSQTGRTALAQMPAPTGFVHGYDLMRLVIAAADQAAATEDWQGDITAKRAALRKALEHLQDPIDGILKRYDAPFHPYATVGSDAHEALGLEDLCLARFDASGQLEDAR